MQCIASMPLHLHIHNIGMLPMEPNQHLSHAHIWQAFVQDSLCTIAAESNIDLELNDPLNITEVTTQAFDLLGPNTQCHDDANEEPPLPPNYFSPA